MSLKPCSMIVHDSTGVKYQKNRDRKQMGGGLRLGKRGQWQLIDRVFYWE